MATLNNGYAGKILRVDLTSGEIEQTPLHEIQARSYIGGFGINAQLASHCLPKGADPLSADNPLILGAGPLVGTPAPGAARLALTTKFPEVKAVFASNGSMNFGTLMKYAGYDHILITGQSERPVYIYFDEKVVKILDAADLWGRDVFQTTDILWNRHSSNSSVIAIGQAGENLIPISLSIIDKVASFGNKGGAAVFGSKKLKAIVANGQGGIRVAHPEQFSKLVNQFFHRAKRDPFHAKQVELGSMAKFRRTIGPIVIGTKYFPPMLLSRSSDKGLSGKS